MKFDIPFDGHLISVPLKVVNPDPEVVFGIDKEVREWDLNAQSWKQATSIVCGAVYRLRIPNPEDVDVISIEGDSCIVTYDDIVAKLIKLSVNVSEPIGCGAEEINIEGTTLYEYITQYNADTGELGEWEHVPLLKPGQAYWLSKKEKCVCKGMTICIKLNKIERSEGRISTDDATYQYKGYGKVFEDILTSIGRHIQLGQRSGNDRTMNYPDGNFQYIWRSEE